MEMLNLLGKAFMDSQPLFAAVFVAGTAAGIADSKHQATIPANAPVCVMETVKAEGGNYYFSRQKPGVCRL